MNDSTHSTDQPVLRSSERRGSDPTLLLLHGVTRCGADWEPLLTALNSPARMIALDHRGHGQSARAPRYLVNDYTADVVQFVRSEARTPWIIIGHSLGAMVAASVAAELPEHVCGIVLEDPPFHTMGNRIAGSPWQIQFIGMQAAARRGGSVAEIADRLADIRLPARSGGECRLGDLRHRDSLMWSATCLQALDPEVLTPVIEGRWLDRYDMAEVFSRVHCPVLLLQADPTAGGALVDSDADAIVDRCTGCQLVRFPGAGHQLHRDHTQSMIDALQPFLESLITTPSCRAASHKENS